MTQTDLRFADRPPLHFTRERTLLLGGDSRLSRLAERGQLKQLRRGAYIDTTVWCDMNRDARYVARVHAVAGTRIVQPIFSSYSAAALWGLPLVGAWPGEVHVVAERAAGRRSDPGIRRHAVGLPASISQTPDGLLLTGVARTLVDLAAQASFASGVATIDHALRREWVTKDELRAVVAGLMPFRGSRKASAAIEFSTHLSDSVSESVSLVNMARWRFPVPVLQQKFLHPSGRCYFTDFWWPRWRLIGETDGRIKYDDPVYLRGRTPAQALWDEKQREDWLRSEVNGFGRWPWEVSNEATALGRRLIRLGLPQLPRGHPEGFAVAPPR